MTWDFAVSMLPSQLRQKRLRQSITTALLPGMTQAAVNKINFATSNLADMLVHVTERELAVFHNSQVANVIDS